jgi:hypothetical protein
MNLDNVECITISKIVNETKLLGITCMHKVECNTFLTDVSTYVFLILQQESIFKAAKGLTSTNLWKQIIC